MIRRPVRAGADLPPAEGRKAALWAPNPYRSIPLYSMQISFVYCCQTHGFTVFAYCILYWWRKCRVWAVFVYLPFVCRLRCLRGSGGWPGGRRLVAPTSPRSVVVGLLDLAKNKGAEVWLRRFLLRMSLSIGLDLAFLLISPVVGTGLPKSRDERQLTGIEDTFTPQENISCLFIYLVWIGCYSMSHL